MPRQQSTLIEETDWDVIIWLDGGRYDYFEEVLSEDLHGDLEEVHNGGHGYTADWMEDHFEGYYDAQFFCGGQPIWSMLSTEYDERKHFADVVPHQTYNWDEDLGTCTPEVALSVFLTNYDGGRALVRFIAPHPPFPEMVDLTRSKARVRKVTQAIAAGDVSKESIVDAYRSYYRAVLEVASNLVDRVEGTVIITADHGELLGERGHWFHGLGYPEIPELLHVPWFEADMSGRE